MTADQTITLIVLVVVVAALIWDKVRADVVALAGAAVLLMTGVVRPVEVQAAFASPAIIALASLFVISYALELSGLLDRAIEGAVVMCRRLGAAGIWLLLVTAGVMSSFLNSTPIVVITAPIVKDVAETMHLSAKRYLMPLSYITVLGGCCTLLGTSTNLLVDDMARLAGQSRFGIFEITPVGLPVAIAGGLYLVLFSGRMMGTRMLETGDAPAKGPLEIAGAQIGDPEVFAERRPLQPVKAAIALVTFVGAILLAALDVAPIAATAFTGAVLLILLRVISADQAYGGLRPQVLILIAGMVVLGIAMAQSGLAAAATTTLIDALEGDSPLTALIVLYGLTMVLTELLSNATVAVLVTPIAVALAESLGVSPRPFLVVVMIAGSAAFATPFGYQTNVIVYQLGRYRYTDFLRVGLLLNLITAVVAILAIQIFFPF
jgi:di/tricarboxylate transporter